MCFSIPFEVIETTDTHLILENQKKIKKDKKHLVKKGEYVRIAAGVIVDVLTRHEGQSVKELIASVYETSV